MSCQFRLRTLFLATVAASGGSAVLSRMQLADRREQAAATAIWSSGGGVDWAVLHRVRFLPRQRYCVGVSLARADTARLNFAILLDMPRLSRIYASGAALEDQHITIISKLPMLRELNISGTKVTDVGASMLVRCRQLERVYVARTHISSDGISALAALPRLELLFADECEIDDRALLAVARCGTIKSLTASSDQLTDCGLRALRTADHLEYIELGGHFSAAAIVDVKQLPQLRYLTLFPFTDAVVRASGQKTTDIRGRWLRVGDGGWRRFFGGVRIQSKDIEDEKGVRRPAGKGDESAL